MSMKALRLSSSGGRLELVQAPKPQEPELGQVIVKVAYSGVCGSDIGVIDGKLMCRDELILGHEFSGTIESVGEGVRNVKFGDRVAVNPMSGCGTCRTCTRGRPNVCVSGIGGGNSYLGAFHNGGWAEYCEVPAINLVVLPDSLSLKHAALSEPVSDQLNGVRRSGELPSDARILVMGAGIAGYIFGSLFHYYGQRDITFSNRSEPRRKMIANAGLGFKAFHPDEISQTCTNMEELEKNGFDLILEATGNPSAVSDGFKCIRFGGTMNLYGLSPVGSNINIDPSMITLKELTIKGSMLNCHSFADAVHLISIMADTYFDFEKVGIKCYKLEQYEEAVDAMRRKEITKALFQIGE